MEKQPSNLMVFLRDKGTLPPVIFIYGPDGYTRESLVSRVVGKYLAEERNRAFGLEEYEAPEADPPHLLSTLKTIPLGQPLKVIVLRRFELVSSSVLKDEKRGEATDREGKSSPLDEALLRYFKQPSRKTLLVISSATGLRKNSRVYRALPEEAVLVPCTGFRANEAVAFVKKKLTEEGKQAAGPWVEQFVEIVGPDAQRLAGELEKIFLFVGDRDALNEGDLEVVSSTEMPRDVFALLNAIAAGKRGHAVEIMREILSSAEPPLRILSVLLWHYRLVSKAWHLMKLGSREKLSGIHPSRFVVNKVTRQARGISRTGLREIFTHLREADQLLKGSRLPPARVMEALVYFLSGQSRRSMQGGG